MKGRSSGRPFRLSRRHARSYRLELGVSVATFYPWRPPKTGFDRYAFFPPHDRDRLAAMLALGPAGAADPGAARGSREQGAGSALVRAHRAPDAQDPWSTSTPSAASAGRTPPWTSIFRRFFGDNAPGVPRGRSQSSLGSGVIVDPSGLVITNNHVIENMTEVKVALADRREFEAEIVLRDPRTDLAVLKLKDATNLQAVELGDSEALQVGDLVLAIGNPFGVGQTVTQGIVSALARTQVGDLRLPVLHPDGCGHQPGQFRRRADRHERPRCRHQHGHLFPLRRQHRHRLRRAVEHGPGGAELRARRLPRT